MCKRHIIQYFSYLFSCLFYGSRQTSYCNDPWQRSPKSVYDLIILKIVFICFHNEKHLITLNRRVTKKLWFENNPREVRLLFACDTDTVYLTSGFSLQKVIRQWREIQVMTVHYHKAWKWQMFKKVKFSEEKSFQGFRATRILSLIAAITIWVV